MLFYWPDLYGWSNSCLPIADLTEDMNNYLRNLNVLPRNYYPIVPVLERDLILNRLYWYVEVKSVDLKICPLHRYTFGVGWRIHNRCCHSDHNVSFNESRSLKRGRKTSVTALRTAPFDLVEKIVGFPYGGKICDIHRKQLYQDDVAMNDFDLNYMSDDGGDDVKTNSTIQSFVSPEKSQYKRAQHILHELGESPIKSQTRIPLKKQTPGAVRRLAAKLRKSVAAATATFSKSLAPEEASRLINVCILTKYCEELSLFVFQIAGLDGVMKSRSSSTENNVPVDEAFLIYLVDMYKSYEERNFPYNEKISLLTLIPENWNLSYDDIISRFGCTQHAIKTARYLKNASSTPLHVDERQ
jgi:hypothetical protein